MAGFIAAVVLLSSVLVNAAHPSLLSRQAQANNTLNNCPGYAAHNIAQTPYSLSADLVLAGHPCNAFGQDLPHLKLTVEYEDVSRIHVKITDADSPRYEVPVSVLPRPSSKRVAAGSADILFKLTAAPFSFAIVRRASGETLFDTAGFPLMFEPQYLRVKTKMPPNANIYGLGEHTERFRLPTHNLTRTLWTRDAFSIPVGTNLYGSHPVYFEHRKTGTHGVFLLNSNGMDIKIDDAEPNATTLEYNTIGGVLDFYFLAGSTPVELAKQYAAVVGTPAEVPYWSLGFHQCRFNYTDFVAVADVITNYSAAAIPLETMWTDIDYMYLRRTFTNDPQYFPTDKVRQIVDYLHNHHQQYIMMVDPAVAFLENQNYGPFDRGKQDDVFLKNPNGTIYKGLVWPGVTAFPDWFHPKIQDYWTGEFQRFFSPETGFDIDGVWLDMNEPATFCPFPCDDPEGQARLQNLPPPRLTPPPPPNTPIFQNIQKRQQKDVNVSLLHPQYAIKNAAGELSDRTAYTNLPHIDGHMMYDTHNLFGTMMGAATREAMVARRQGLRPFLIIRSTFAGAGRKVGKWLGDNVSLWEHYRQSIASQLGMASIFQVPMVGSDVCGFAGDTTEKLCARWAMLGAFSTFYRNHNIDNGIPQEFYRFPLTAQAARYVIDIRYRLLDYIYTALHQASVDGTPVLNPMWYLYPEDTATWPIDLQFFYGDAILVSPVTKDDATDVDIYLPQDIFYDFATLAPVEGQGKTVSLTNVNFTTIPLHIRGGTIVPMRVEGAMTTVELRKRDFDIVVAPGRDGTAQGALYLDDGVSLVQQGVTAMKFSYKAGRLEVSGSFGYAGGVRFRRALVLNVGTRPKGPKVNGVRAEVAYETGSKVATVTMNVDVSHGFVVELQ